jgi:hypothetical protein
VSALSPEEIRQAVEDGRSFATHACSTCRHRQQFEKCGATGAYCSTERRNTWSACGARGQLWEAKPPRQRGIFEIAWRFLFGG